MFKNAWLDAKLTNIPKQPGCYFWLDQNRNILYIGKAKNLFNRTRSYFLKSLNRKTQKLVAEIADVDFIITASENHALILESDLIKKHKPKYNILLKDNNGYPYLFLTNEPKPRLFYTKAKIANLRGKYFGPFATSQSKPYELYQLLKKILPIQDCNHRWNLECFKCEILKQIQIPILPPDQQDFKSIAKLISQILQGHTQDLCAHLETQELYANQTLAFESAQKFYQLRQHLLAINNSQYMKMRQADHDIVGFKINDAQIAIIVFNVVTQKLYANHQQVFEYVGDWKTSLSQFLDQYYSNHRIPKMVYISYLDTDLQLLAHKHQINFVIPKSGEPLTWMTTAFNNAQALLEQTTIKQVLKWQRTTQAHTQLQHLLQLEQLERIEMFDIAQLFGDHRVGARVVFVNGKLDYTQNRKYIIQDHQAQSDFDCMREVLRRRFGKVHNDLIKPDLILIDGGIGHYNLLQQVLAELQLLIPFGALVKNHKHQTDQLIFNNKVIDIKTHQNVFFYLSNIQTAVHQFALKFFKHKNHQSQLSSFYQSIKGLGPKSVVKLQTHFDSFSQIKQASIEELSQIIPPKVAQLLHTQLQLIDTQNLTLQNQLPKSRTTKSKRLKK